MANRPNPFLGDHPVSAWRVSKVVECNWHDGLESGFVILSGPADVVLIMERVGTGTREALYHAWILPDEFRQPLAAIGEALIPSRPHYFACTMEAPMEAELLDAARTSTGPKSLVVEFDEDFAALVYVGLIHREWTAAPSELQFGRVET